MSQYQEILAELNAFNKRVWSNPAMPVPDGNWTEYINGDSTEIVDAHGEIMGRLLNAANVEGVDTSKDENFHLYGEAEPAVDVRCKVSSLVDFAFRTSWVDGSTLKLLDYDRGYLNGFGLAIHTNKRKPVNCVSLDFSPVLRPESRLIENFEGRERHRILFAEWHCHEQPPFDGIIRSIGDVFCLDRKTADYVKDAVNEKIRRDFAGGQNRPWQSNTAGEMAV